MGILVASSIILFWLGHISYILLYFDMSISNPMTYLHIAVQAYLYTGLFITGHDAMHGTVSMNKVINKIIGRISVFLFAGMSYSKLLANHKLHHKFPASENDPDFSTKSQNFWLWWLNFMWKYITISQLLIMALIFNLLKYTLNLSDIKILIFWALPAILATLQLFYFGTYLPHKLPHHDEMGIHKSRTQAKNHIWAMLSCYFFGYHLEHHISPGTPWWKLYTMK